MEFKSKALLAFAFLLLVPLQAGATSVALSFNQLTGTTPLATGVYRADLAGIGLSNLASITVRDAGGSAGSPGIWSGYDLDAIKLSEDFCLTAACASTATAISLFDFVNNVIFTPGTLDATALVGLTGTCLQGTSGGGCDVDDSSATLGLFDGTYSGNGTAGSPNAGSGWLSLGRGGVVSFNLTSLLALGTHYLYVGEVGDNGETLRGLVEVSDIPSAVPVPAAVWLFGTALVGFFGMSRRRRIG